MLACLLLQGAPYLLTVGVHTRWCEYVVLCEPHINATSCVVKGVACSSPQRRPQGRSRGEVFTWANQAPKRLAAAGASTSSTVWVRQEHGSMLQGVLTHLISGRSLRSSTQVTQQWWHGGGVIMIQYTIVHPSKAKRAYLCVHARRHARTHTHTHARSHAYIIPVPMYAKLAH